MVVEINRFMIVLEYIGSLPMFSTYLKSKLKENLVLLNCKTI